MSITQPRAAAAMLIVPVLIFLLITGTITGPFLALWTSGWQPSGVGLVHSTRAEVSSAGPRPAGNKRTTTCEALREKLRLSSSIFFTSSVDDIGQKGILTKPGTHFQAKQI